MTWPGFLAAGSAWLFLLLVPLIVFYFLKLKRPRMDIPSLALWRSVLADRRVNSPFQKFKRNLLLLLQLLLLVCLILAAMQPFWPSGAERVKNLPVLIDCSASMAALDKPGGISRLDEAKQRVGQLIDELLPDQRLSLISVSNTARRLTEFTENKRVLRDALEQLKVSQVPSRLEDALRMTQALARTVPVESVLLFTDGNVPSIVDFELPFQLNFQRLPSAGANLGITALNAQLADEKWEIFVRVESTKSAPGAAEVMLFKQGEKIGEESISLEPGQSQRLSFTMEASGPTAVEVRLKPDGFDALDSDNTAYLDLPLARPLTIFCPTELGSYRQALKGIKEVVVYPADEGGDTASSYDLVISDRKEDAELEAGTFVFVGVVPDDVQKLLRIEESAVQVVDWQRSTPLLQHVLLAEVQIADNPISAEGVQDKDYEELGYEILAQARSGPLVLRKDLPGKQMHYILFHTDRSTLPYRVGFPILVTNVIHIAERQAGLSEAVAQPTGVLPPRTLSPEKSYEIIGPDDRRQSARASTVGVLSGVGAPVIGRYSIRDSGQEVASVGVSLLGPSETSLVGIDQLQFREVSVAAAETILKNDRPLWPWFAGMGFGLLLVEWWYFQRRPAGMP